ncbi:MAG: MraY family glycosyltransferase [Candidatus Uhrbacteria bacterium]
MTPANLSFWIKDFLLLAPYFLAAFFLSLLLTKVVRYLATRFKIIDEPNCPRKIHQKPVPLLGGAAIFVSLAAVVFFLLLKTEYLTSGEIGWPEYTGFFLGGLVLMIGGFLDDKFSLPPKFSIVAPILAAGLAVAFGIQVEKLTNPFGGIIYLAAWQSDVLVFVWLLTVIYTTKFLDGLDGLATGIGSIGTLMIMLLSLTVAYFQPDVALLSAVALGTLFGFLVFNFQPASIFLGEGGSTFIGYLIGVLAVISGGKLATALLVIGIPLVDIIFVIIRRWRRSGLKSIVRGDREHLHHKLLEVGFSDHGVVFFYYALAGGFGVLTLFLQSKEKLIAFGLLILLAVLAAVGLSTKKNITNYDL